MTKVIVSLKFPFYIYSILKKLQYILALLAFVSILFHSGAYTAVFVDFQLNKSYIVNSLCENRFTPELKCEGKCYLKKQLNKHQQRDAEGVLAIQENLHWVHEYAETEEATVIITVTDSPIGHHATLSNQHSAVPQPHPPCLV